MNKNINNKVAILVCLRFVLLSSTWGQMSCFHLSCLLLHAMMNGTVLCAAALNKASVCVLPGLDGVALALVLHDWLVSTVFAMLQLLKCH